MKIVNRNTATILSFFRKVFIWEQITKIPIVFYVLFSCIIFTGLLLLYSAGGGFSPWCFKQMVRLLLALGAMFFVAATPIMLWQSFAYLFYCISLLLLFLTLFLGIIGMGAQRWIGFAFLHFQPSELMRISLVLALARYFNNNPIAENCLYKRLVIPISLVIFPVVFTIFQPDLGTALLLLMGSGILYFFAGVRLRFFAWIFTAFLGFLPIFWSFLHDYQKKRIFTFLNPENDPLGAGYHIIQSKIAIGSGGFWGKGFLKGTQGALNFLPEKQTDFIFTLLSEEFGFLGVLWLLGLYLALTVFNFSLAFRARSLFGRLTISGLTASFILYAIINISMVVGLLPVVGIPLPLISYGGTSLVAMLVSQGIIMSAAFQK